MYICIGGRPAEALPRRPYRGARRALLPLQGRAAKASRGHT